MRLSLLTLIIFVVIYVETTSIVVIGRYVFLCHFSFVAFTFCGFAHHQTGLAAKVSGPLSHSPGLNHTFLRFKLKNML